MEAGAEYGAMNEEELNTSLQKPLMYNRLLPYSFSIDDEAEKLFAEIRMNLGRCVALREVTPVAGYWLAQLHSFLELYGYHFTKTDHVVLVEFLLELLVIRGLDLVIVGQLAHAISLLLKRRELLSRDQLCIQWRPLYELYERLECSRDRELGLLRPPANLATRLETMVACCRVYFSAASTIEMLEEWLPLLCPFDRSMQKAMAYFQLFLPTTLPPDQHGLGFRLWFDNFIEIWENSHNSPEWENNLVWLFTRLAEDNIGWIDWNPYIPTIFTRILRSFDLPDSRAKGQRSRHRSSYDSAAVVRWVAALLGGNSSCQAHLYQLVKVTAPFFHSSSAGHLAKLHNVLFHLPTQVVRRLRRERYQQFSWEQPPPESHRMSDADVADFVQCLAPVVLVTMGNEGEHPGAALALHELASLRPDMVIPPVLERFYCSLETPIDPLRLRSSMSSVVAVARSLVDGGPEFPEGPKHVLPVLNNCLLGIDSSDPELCALTLHLIWTYTAMVPLVDCSEVANVRTDLTELEKDVCQATAGFQNFVLQLMDKCFSLIEDSDADELQHPALDVAEANANLLEGCLSTTLSTVFEQCSPDLLKAALEKLKSFVFSTFLTIQKPRHYVATLCRAMAEAKPELVLGTFVRDFVTLVLAITDSKENDSDKSNEDGLHNLLLLLSEIIACDGWALQPYVMLLLKVLRRTLHSPSNRCRSAAGDLLNKLLRACSRVYPSDSRSTSLDWEQYLDFAKHIPTKEWGQPEAPKDVHIRWHVPSTQELTCMQSLLQTFLRPELRVLFLWSRGDRPMTSNELQISLGIVQQFILGLATCLPMWPEEPINHLGTTTPVHVKTKMDQGSKSVNFRSGLNVRQVVADVVHGVLARSIQTREYNVETFRLIIELYDYLLFYWSRSEEDLASGLEWFSLAKKSLDNKLAGDKKRIRALQVHRAHLLHEMRQLGQGMCTFTRMHQDIMHDLFRLSTCAHKEIWTHAQKLLGKCLDRFFASNLPLLKGLAKQIRPTDGAMPLEICQEALYTLLINNPRTLLLLRDWPCLGLLWPMLVGAPNADTPSIAELIDDITDTMQVYHETIQLKLKVPSSCLEMARNFASAVGYDDMVGAVEEEESCNDSLYSEYETLVCTLASMVESGVTDRQHGHLAVVMIKLLIRNDVTLPVPGLHVLLFHLLDGMPRTCKVAVQGVGMVLRQQKQKHFKEEVDTQYKNSLELSPTLATLVDRTGGLRPVSLWLQYNSACLPLTKAKWNKYRAVHQTHVGFNQMSSNTVLVYAPENRQPTLVRNAQDFNLSEQAIYRTFKSQGFVKDLSACACSTERSFDFDWFYLFKGIFRNFGPAFLPEFKTVIRMNIADGQAKHQRGALEMLAGIMRGSKHWSFEMMQQLRQTVEPALRLGLSRIVPGTLPAWGTCMAGISERRDPNKYHWLFELLAERTDEDSVSLQTSRLRLHLAAIAQQEWRVCELLHDELERLKPRLECDDPDVREKISSFLRRIFAYDVRMSMFEDALMLVPRTSSFVKHLLPRLAPLAEAPGEKPPQTHDHEKQLASGKGRATSANRAAANVLKTACRWIIGTATYSPIATLVDMFNLVPVLCITQANQDDLELQFHSKEALAHLGNATLRPENILAVQDIIAEVMQSPMWEARVAICELLRSLAMSNVFALRGCPDWMNFVEGNTLTLLKDPQLQVRETAAETLRGFFYQGVLDITDKLLALFRDQFVKKSPSSEDISKPDEAHPQPRSLVERHAGTLGLCACINANPHDLPGFLPEQLRLLTGSNDVPRLISETIREALVIFRSAHQDNWLECKTNFTDDQLAVISDVMLQPPNCA